MYVCINVCVYDNITSIIWHRKPNISISHIDIGDKLCLKYASCFFYGHYCIYVLYIMMCVMCFPIMNRAGWIWSAKSTATESCLS